MTKRMQAGFTIIELIVVVAIFGILAAIMKPQLAPYLRNHDQEARLACLRVDVGETVFKDASGGYTDRINVLERTGILIPDNIRIDLWTDGCGNWYAACSSRHGGTPGYVCSWDSRFPSNMPVYCSVDPYHH